MSLFLRKCWTWLRYAWPLVSEYIEHGFDADGMTRKDWHHAIDMWCDSRGME